MSYISNQRFGKSKTITRRDHCQLQSPTQSLAIATAYSYRRVRLTAHIQESLLLSMSFTASYSAVRITENTVYSI